MSEDRSYEEDCRLFHEARISNENYLISKLPVNPSSDVVLKLTKEEAILLYQLAVRGAK